jgi:hypothetical protein
MQTDVEIYAQSRELVKAGQPEAAYQMVLDLVIKKTDLWEPYYETAIFSFYNNDHKTALGFFRMAARRERDSALATVDLTNLLLAMGQYAEALDIWKNKLSTPVSKEVLGAFMEFLSGKGESGDRAQAFFMDRIGGPKVGYPEFCHLARQGTLERATQVLPAETIPAAKVCYHNMQAPLTSASDFPGIFRFALDDAIARPYSDVVISGDKGFIPDHCDLEEHLLYDTFTRRSIPMAGGELLLLGKDPVRKRMSAGIILTSYAITNWTHFLTEIMPIVALVEAQDVPVEIPLLISRPGALQMLEFLDLIKAPGRPIEIIDDPVQVEHATWFTPVSTVPFEWLKSRCGKEVHYSLSDCLFSPGAIAALKARIGKVCPSAQDVKRVKVLIDRNSARRRVTNREEVVRYFSEKGYVIAVPEQMSLKEQMDLFSKASVIVGQTGAGLANMLFAPAGARIIVLSGHPEDPGPHNYFPNIARTLGHEVHFMAFGSPSPNLHIDFEVDLAFLNQHIELL